MHFSNTQHCGSAFLEFLVQFEVSIHLFLFIFWINNTVLTKAMLIPGLKKFRSDKFDSFAFPPWITIIPSTNKAACPPLACGFASTAFHSSVAHKKLRNFVINTDEVDTQVKGMKIVDVGVVPKP